MSTSTWTFSQQFFFPQISRENRKNKLHKKINWFTVYGAIVSAEMKNIPQGDIDKSMA